MLYTGPSCSGLCGMAIYRPNGYFHQPISDFTVAGIRQPTMAERWRDKPKVLVNTNPTLIC